MDCYQPGDLIYHLNLDGVYEFLIVLGDPDGPKLLDNTNVIAYNTYVPMYINGEFPVGYPGPRFTKRPGRPFTCDRILSRIHSPALPDDK